MGRAAGRRAGRDRWVRPAAPWPVVERGRRCPARFSDGNAGHLRDAGEGRLRHPGDASEPGNAHTWCWRQRQEAMRPDRYRRAGVPAWLGGEQVDAGPGQLGRSCPAPGSGLHAGFVGHRRIIPRRSPRNGGHHFIAAGLQRGFPDQRVRPGWRRELSGGNGQVPRQRGYLRLTAPASGRSVYRRNHPASACPAGSDGLREGGAPGPGPGTPPLSRNRGAGQETTSAVLSIRKLVVRYRRLSRPKNSTTILRPA